MEFRSLISAVVINNLSRLLSLRTPRKIFSLRNAKHFHRTRQNLVNKLPFTMKINSPQFRSIFTPEMEVLMGIFRKYGYELRIAGGAVRDILLSIEPKDLDFATTATPKIMKDMFETENVRMINTKGESHGTIVARINDKVNYEITTLRIDIVTDGRRAQVKFTEDWQLDSERRDLTINAMFLGTDGTLYDYYNGYNDLQVRKVAFVGDAYKRIQEDYLRILRYFRFFGRITHDTSIHDLETLEAIKDNIGGLEQLSGERIWSELKKILAGNFADQIMEVITNLGIAPYLGFPNDLNIVQLKYVYRQSKHFYLHPITLISSLFKSSEDFLDFHTRVKLSNFERDLGLFLIEHRNCMADENDINFYKSLIVKSMSKIKPKDKKAFVCELLKYLNKESTFHTVDKWVVPKFPVDGRTLVKKGIKKTCIYKSVVNEMERRWIESDFTLGEDELLNMFPEIIEFVNSKNIIVER